MYLLMSGLVPSTLWLGFIFIHVPLPASWRMWPASVQAVGDSTELFLVGYPLLVFFKFFLASTFLCFCAFELTLVPTVATVHLSCLLALASCKLSVLFLFVDYAAFQKLFHFFGFLFVCE